MPPVPICYRSFVAVGIIENSIFFRLPIQNRIVPKSGQKGNGVLMLHVSKTNLVFLCVSFYFYQLKNKMLKKLPLKRMRSFNVTRFQKEFRIIVFLFYFSFVFTNEKQNVEKAPAKRIRSFNGTNFQKKCWVLFCFSLVFLTIKNEMIKRTPTKVEQSFDVVLFFLFCLLRVKKRNIKKAPAKVARS